MRKLGIKLIKPSRSSCQAAQKPSNHATLWAAKLPRHGETPLVALLRPLVLERSKVARFFITPALLLLLLLLLLVSLALTARVTVLPLAEVPVPVRCPHRAEVRVVGVGEVLRRGHRRTQLRDLKVPVALAAVDR